MHVRVCACACACAQFDYQFKFVEIEHIFDIRDKRMRKVMGTPIKETVLFGL